MRTLKLIALCAACLLFLFSSANTSLSLDEAVKKKMVTAVIKGKGGFTGPVIDLTIKCIVAQPVTVTIEPGRKLHPDDAGMQDILVTQSLVVVLQPAEEKKLIMNGMCCISHNAPPSPGMGFKIGKMADSSLIRLANFINSTKMHKSADAQHAVWVFSDNKRIEGIDITNPMNKPLIDFVTRLGKLKTPEYSIEYEKEENVAFNETACKVKGFFNCKIEKPGTLAMVLFDETGKELSRDEMPGPAKPANYKFEYGFRVKGYAKGIYYGKVILDGKILSEVKLEI